MPGTRCKRVPHGQLPTRNLGTLTAIRVPQYGKVRYPRWPSVAFSAPLAARMRGMPAAWGPGRYGGWAATLVMQGEPARVVPRV